VTLAALRETLPGLRFTDDPAALRAYAVANPLVASLAPLAAALPRNVDELEALIRAAGALGVSLVPVASRGPHGKGGLASDRAHVAIDLAGWKCIDLIDRRNRVCRVEPGVTYPELLTALTPHGLTVPMPLAPRAGKSVLAAMLDREPTTWPVRQWDSADPIASTEFLFGTGDRFRTGAAGGPGDIKQQRAAGGALKSPLGPSQTDFQRLVQGSQGAMGIVTWVTLRCELLPSVEKPLVFEGETLGELTPFVYELLRAGLGEQCFLLDAAAAALLLGRPLHDAAPYLVYVNAAGFERLAEERAAYQAADIRDMAARHGLRPVPGSLAGDLRAVTAHAGGEQDWRHGPGGHALALFFQTTLDRAADFRKIAGAVARESGLEPARLGLYVQPQIQNHACHVELILRYTDADTLAVRHFESAAVDALLDAGAFFSRPYGSGRRAFARNPGATALLGRIKRIFDPHDILHRGALPC
jgi:FAD/FMN-containing dehydrogenase